MPVYKTPGVYAEEISTLPPSVADVSTAIPAFFGYTEIESPKAQVSSLRVSSLLEFTEAFGGAHPATFVASTSTDPATRLPVVTAITPSQAPNPDRLLYYAVSHYFANGGGPCYILSLGNYARPVAKADFQTALTLLALEDEPTLIVLTDAVLLLGPDYYEVAQAALAQCASLKDRFTILDVPSRIDADAPGPIDTDAITTFRKNIGMDNLSYAAAYYPYLLTSLNFAFDEAGIQVKITDQSVASTVWEASFPPGPNGLTISFTSTSAATPNVQIVAADPAQDVAFAITATGRPRLTISNAGSKNAKQITDRWTAWKQTNSPQGFDMRYAGDGSAPVAPTTTDGTDLVIRPGAGAPPAKTLADLKTTDTARYNQVKDAMTRQRVTLPPSAAIAGIYAQVDRNRGVWKAPANVSVAAVVSADKKMTDADQADLNVDPTAGKSINAIRDFTGKGTLVWGARTLAGNDNEWRYVPVRRLFISIEENTCKASAFAVFEPNDATTWLKVRGMIESYLYSLWQRGALAGAKPEAAYYVIVGLGKTMTAQDVLEGRLIVEIGIAAVRPAEFIVLRFMHMLQQS